VSSYTKDQTKVYTQRPDICASLAGDPEHGQISLFIEFQKFGFVDSSDTKLAFYGRNERGTLK
jgi:hypothetical protein